MARRMHDVGFDVAKAIERLHQAAVREGAVPAGDGRSESPILTAYAHLHGIERGFDCPDAPCRKAGLCHALFELLEYRAEVEQKQTVLTTIDRAHEASRSLQKMAQEFAEFAERLPKEMEKGRAFHFAGDRVPRAYRDVLRTQPRRIRQRIGGLLRSIVDYETALGGLIASPELSQAAGSKRTTLLLRAVWQHLDWGGCTYEEISDLVPSVARPRNVKDTVRKRIREEDARSMRPRELHPRLAPRGRVDKRQRRRSST